MNFSILPPGTRPGGHGASVSGDIVLTSRTTLQIVVAGQGTTNHDGTLGGGGGGGGTFIFISGQTQTLLVAGGGGGAAPFTIGGDARTDTRGANSFNTTPGGSDGSAGFANGGGGGAGWFANGQSVSSGIPQGGFSAPSFASGIGGSYINGGFGGGGGGNDGSAYGAGGGGGYSGGGAGAGAGGGGPYLGADFTNDSLLTTTNTGNGYVTLEAVPEPASISIVSIADATLLRRRR